MTVVVINDPTKVPTAPIDGKPTFVYWDIVGLANPCRYVLAIAGEEFVDVRLDPGDKEDEKTYKMTWLAAKQKQVAEAMALPNLPYYMEDGVGPFSQSDAILRHLGRKFNLMGVAGKEHIVDMCVDELKDYEGQYVSLVYAQGKEPLKAWLEGSIPTLLMKWSRILGNQEFLTGDKVSIADVKLYAFLDRLKILQEKVAASFDCSKDWAEYMKRMENFPGLREYLVSPEHIQSPLNNPHAKIN